MLALEFMHNEKTKDMPSVTPLSAGHQKIGLGRKHDPTSSTVLFSYGAPFQMCVMFHSVLLTPCAYTVRKGFPAMLSDGSESSVTRCCFSLNPPAEQITNSLVRGYKERPVKTGSSLAKNKNGLTTVE
jgi:hypothetical protein